MVLPPGYWDMGVQPWSFDVCTNTWQPQSPAPWTGVTWGGPAVVYDPGLDAILALTVNETHATRVAEYSTATDDWTETTVPQRLLPWAYSVDSDTWALLPTIEFPPGFESAALTHAALDPPTGKVLFLMEDAGSRTLWSYSPAWKTLTNMGGPAPAGRSGDPTLILDPKARRVVLILWGSAAGIPGETWTFDLFSHKWTDQEAEPPDLASEESAPALVESRGEAAFDPISQRTFVLMNGELATYQTGADHWDAVDSDPGWPLRLRPAETEEGRLTGPLGRTGHSLVYDPVHQRILVFGGTWQMANGGKQSGDVWAYDVPTNTWTELVRPIAG